MYVSVRPHVALAASLLLAGCYAGADNDDGGGISSGPGGGATSVTSVSPPEATSGESGASTTGADDPSATGDGDDVSTGEVDPTTGGEDDTTGAPATTDPATTDPGTGDPSATDAGDETGAADSGMMDPVDVPDSAHCADVAGWSPAWAQLEQEVLVLVNQKRSEGANCGSKGAFAPVGPLTMDPALRCAARKHSADMAARNFFDHTNPDGEAPWDRMGEAGYGSYSAAGENIAAGSPDAQGTMAQWMGSDGHCANIMSPSFQHIGVGYSTGGQYGHLWTQVFGAK